MPLATSTMAAGASGRASGSPTIAPGAVADPLGAGVTLPGADGALLPASKTGDGLSGVETEPGRMIGDGDEGIEKEKVRVIGRATPVALPVLWQRILCRLREHDGIQRTCQLLEAQCGAQGLIISIQRIG